MAWVKLDDQFTDHPKVIEAGPMASWLFVCGLTYCARLLTDGFIPSGQVRKLADLDGAPDLATHLVTVGLWERCEGGFLVHDYLEYQPSAEKVKAERAATAKRQADWRARHAGGDTIGQDPLAPLSPNGVSNAVTNGHVTPAPYPSRSRPVPNDVSEISEKSPLAGSRQPYPADFIEFWHAYGATNGPKKPAFVAWQRLSKADKAEALAALPAWHQSQSWRDGFKPYPQKYLSQRYWEGEPAAAVKTAYGNGPRNQSDVFQAIARGEL